MGWLLLISNPTKELNRAGLRLKFQVGYLLDGYRKLDDFIPFYSEFFQSFVNTGCQTPMSHFFVRPVLRKQRRRREHVGANSETTLSSFFALDKKIPYSSDASLPTCK
jgi:hypothetical protein